VGPAVARPGRRTSEWAPLIIANTRTVTVSWVSGSTHQPLVWVVASAALSLLLGILTSLLFRFRTHRAASWEHE
jgi:uncharacterized integral membrane protein